MGSSDPESGTRRGQCRFVVGQPPIGRCKSIPTLDATGVPGVPGEGALRSDRGEANQRTDE